MRILIYSPYSLRFNGGGERWIVEIASRLSLLRHDITILTTRFGERANQPIDLNLSANIELIELPFIKLPSLGILLPISICFGKLHKIFKSADVIYFNNVFPFQELMILAVKLLYKKPVINMYQAPIYASSRLRKFYQTAVSRHIVRFFNAQHVLNNMDKQILINWKAKNIHYIPNGVATDNFLPWERLPGTKKFKILFVGRLNYHKGFDIFYKIIEIINQHKVLSGDTEFSIIGTGVFKSKAEELQKRYHNVRYLGQINHGKLAGFYASASLLLMTSRYEGMSLVSLEAQSCGLPIIASNVPGLREITFNNESITLINPEDANSFAKAIQGYYNLWKNQRPVYGRLRKTARDNTCKMYNWGRITNLVSELLRSIYIRRTRYAISG